MGVTGARRTEGRWADAVLAPPAGPLQDPSPAPQVPDAFDRARHELAIQTVREFRKVLPAGVPAAVGLAVVLHDRLPVGHP